MPPPLPLAPSTVRTVALVGNPNTGKTTLFNALAGMHQRVGNYPGVTVETKKGRVRHHAHSFDLIDPPATYSWLARRPDDNTACIGLRTGTGTCLLTPSVRGN